MANLKLGPKPYEGDYEVMGTASDGQQYEYTDRLYYQDLKAWETRKLYLSGYCGTLNAMAHCLLQIPEEFRTETWKEFYLETITRHGNLTEELFG